MTPAPNDVHDVMIASFFGAGIVLCGAGYAIFLALSRLSGMTRKQRFLNITALLWYVLLLLCVVGLSTHLNLQGWWLGIVAIMLLGYFFAPRFIWRLSDELHSE